MNAEWTWLYDSYENATAFITDDPTGSQEAIAEGLNPVDAENIVNAHNAVVREIVGVPR